MFSGKSTELIRRLSRYESVGIPTLLINSSLDTRTDNNVKTHNNLTKSARKTKNLMSLVNSIEYLSNNVIGIDEAQFFTDLKDGHRDLINILVGAYVGVLAKSTDYWFKDKDDAEDKETQQLHAANGGNNKVEGEATNG